MMEVNEINSTFYALRILSHGLDPSQIEVTESGDYPASEFTKQEQKLALKMIQGIEDSESTPLNELPPTKVEHYEAALAERIELLAHNDLFQAGYSRPEPGLFRLQTEVEYQESDPLNEETLPSELAAMRLGCTQREIDGLLKLLVGRKVETVGKLRSLSTIKRLNIIRSTFYNDEGRLPNNFEMVASLATLVGSDDEREQVERIKEQIAFLKGWEELKLERLV